MAGSKAATALGKGAATAAKWADFGSCAANIAMNMGGTFNDESLDNVSLLDKYIAAAVSGIGTWGINKATGGGTESLLGRLAAGLPTQARNAATNSALGKILNSVPAKIAKEMVREGVQEAGESASDILGRAAVTGKFDEGALKQIAFESALGALSGGAIGGGVKVREHYAERAQEREIEARRREEADRKYEKTARRNKEAADLRNEIREAQKKRVLFGAA